MNAMILSAGGGWHVLDLLRAGRQSGQAIAVSDFRTLHSDSIREIENIVVRTMPAGSLEQVILRMDLLHAAEARGTRIWNPPRALECCIDKYLTTVRLAEANLPTPRTWCGQSAEDALSAFASLGGDVVIKPLFGSEGRGIVRVADPETAWRVCHAVAQTGGVLYLQEFVRHEGFDLRAFVIGGKTLAAMRRFAGEDWRTNVAQGGRAEPVRLDPDEERLAISAAKAVGCPIAGVDLIRGQSGLRVLEVNAVPGWRALSRVTGIDIAGAILDFIREARS
ncbi:MAG: RimK family alpha-L-glutamate ligase [Gemmataceae bacterium]|nr:RimK family alpha-L-glutamate ligase [Gemmataceae bacterium]